MTMHARRSVRRSPRLRAVFAVVMLVAVSWMRLDRAPAGASPGGLVARFGFDNEAFPGIDSVTPGRDALFTAAFVDGVYRYGANFGGLNTRVVAAASPADRPASSFVLSAWVRATDGASGTIAASHECSGDVCLPGALSRMQLALEPNAVAFHVADEDGGGPDEGGGQHVSSPSDLPRDLQYHHVAGVRDTSSNTLSLWIDGIQVAVEPLLSSVAGPLLDEDGEADPFSMGVLMTGKLETDRLTAHLDDVRLYHGVLGADEIAQLVAERGTTPDFFGQATTIAGPTNGACAYADGLASAARFGYIAGIARDAVTGTLYVTDPFNARIRSIAPDGTVTTLAGDGTSGDRDGPAATAQFRFPYGIAVGPSGAVYVADQESDRIRKIVGGEVTTLAGTNRGFFDGPGDQAKFNEMYGLAVDNDENLYVADKGNNAVRKITDKGVVSTVAAIPARPFSIAALPSGGLLVGAIGILQAIAPDGTVSTVAGAAARGEPRDGVGVAAEFSQEIYGLTIDGAGRALLIHHDGDGRWWLRAVDIASGLVTTVHRTALDVADGPLPDARFQGTALVAPATGQLIIGDGDNCAVRRITFGSGPPPPPTTSTSTTSLGSSTTATTATSTTNASTSTSTEATSTVPVTAPTTSTSTTSTTTTSTSTTSTTTTSTSTTSTSTTSTTTAPIGTISTPPKETLPTAPPPPSAAGHVTTFAGNQCYLTSTNVPSPTEFGTTVAITADPKTGTLYVTEGFRFVRAIAPDGKITTIARPAGRFIPTYRDGPADDAYFESLNGGIAVGPDGAVYVADDGDDRILKIKDGMITSIAGNGTRGYRDGPGSDAMFSLYAPGSSSLAVDPSGTVYVADRLNHAIRRITPSGDVSTFSGGNRAGHTDGPAAGAQFNSPSAIAFTPSGILLVGEDVPNGRLRAVAPDGSVITIAGGAVGEPRDGVGEEAALSGVAGLGVSAKGDVYIIDHRSVGTIPMVGRLRKVDLETRQVTTLHVTTSGYVDGPLADSQWRAPGMTVGIDGKIYIADGVNCVIRQITLSDDEPGKEPRQTTTTTTTSSTTTTPASTTTTKAPTTGSGTTTTTAGPFPGLFGSTPIHISVPGPTTTTTTTTTIPADPCRVPNERRGLRPHARLRIAMVARGVALLRTDGTLDPDGRILEWWLDYGDGSPQVTGNGDPPAEFIHRYATGTWIAELHVLDNFCNNSNPSYALVPTLTTTVPPR